MPNPYSEVLKTNDLSLYIRNRTVTHIVERTVQNIARDGRSRDLLITGEGGAGKTTMLTYIERKAHQNNVFALRWVLGARIKNRTPLEFFKTLEIMIMQEVQRSYGRRSFRRWRSLLDRLKSYQISLGPLGGLEVDLRSGSNSMLFMEAEVPTLFAELAERVTHITKTTGILLLLDDADYLSDEIFELFRSIFPRSGCYTLCITSGQRLFIGNEEGQLEEYRTRLLRPIEWIPIRPLSLDAIKMILHEPLCKHSDALWIDDRHIEFIWYLSGGNPFIALAIGEKCYDCSLSGRQVKLTKYVVRSAMQGILGVNQKIQRYPDILAQMNEELEPR